MAQYVINVKINETSLTNARNELLSLANLAANISVPTSPVRAAQQRQAVAQGARQQTISQSTSGGSNVAAVNAEAKAVDGLTSKHQELVNTLTRSAAAGNARAGAQLAELKETGGEVGVLTAQTARLAAAGKLSFGTTATQVGLIATKLTLWSAAGAVIASVLAVVGKLAENVADVNDAMIGLRRVTGNVGSSIGGAFDRQLAAEGIIKNMRDLNVGAKEAATAAFEMGKAYGNLPEALAASRTALLANKVAEIDLAQASQQLVQVSNAFGLSGFQQERVLDKLNAQQNTLGVNIGKTLEATARAAAVTRSAGGTLNQLVARTAVGIRFTGFAPETVARSQARLAQQVLSSKGQKQIISALQSSRAGKSILEEILVPGDPSRLQNDVDKIFNTISRNFQDLGAQQKNAVAEALTGGRQGGLSVITGALLENGPTVDKQAKIAATSQGASFKELDTVLSSVREQVKSIGTEFAVLGANVERSGFLGVVAVLLASLKSILTVTNDIFGLFNSLPGIPRQFFASVAGLALLLKGASKIAPSQALFSPGGSITGALRQRKEAAAAQIAGEEAAAGIRSTSLTQAQLHERNMIEARLAGERAIAAARTGAQTIGVIPVQRPQVSGFTQQIRRSEEIQARTLAESKIVETKASTNNAVASTVASKQLGVLARTAGILSGVMGTLTRREVVATGQLQAQAAIAQRSTLANSASRFASRTGEVLRSPGGFLAGSILAQGAGSALQDAKPPGQTSIGGSSLQGFGTGLSAGLFTANPFIIGGAAIAGTAAGALNGIRKQNRELEDQVQAHSQFVAGVTDELDRSTKSVESKFGQIDIVETSPKKLNFKKEAEDRTDKIFQDLLPDPSEFDFSLPPEPGSGTGEAFGKSQRKKLIEELAKKDLLLSKELSATNQPIPSGPPKTKFTVEEFDQRNKIIDEQLQISALDISRGRDSIKSSMTKAERRQLDTIRILSSSKPGDSQAKFKIAGQNESVFRSIIDEFNAKGDIDRAKSLIKALSKNDQAFAVVLATATARQKEAIDSVVGGGGSTKQTIDALNAVASASGDSLAQQSSARKAGLKKNFGLTSQESIGLGIGEEVDELGNAKDDFLRSLNASVDAYNNGFISLQEFNRDISINIKRAGTLLRSADPLEVQQGRDILVQAQQVARQRLDNQIAQIDSDVGTGLRSEQGGSKQKINAIVSFLRNPSVQPGSQGAIQAQRELQEAVSGFFDAKIAAIKTEFEPLINNPNNTPEQKIALMNQEAQAILAATSGAGATAELSKAQIEGVGIALGLTVDLNRLLVINVGQALLKARGGILGSVLKFADVGQAVISALKTKAGGDIGKALKALQALGSAKGKGEADEIKNLASGVTGGGSGDDALQTAKDLLDARFELLKALARGDDVKVARLSLLQAKQAAGLAKSKADKIRAQAAIVNAQKDLNETILRDKIEEVDFLLSIEAITGEEAARRLQGFIKFAKGNKGSVRGLRQKIFQLLNQSKNDKTFGLPTEVPLPSILEIKRIIGVSKKIAEQQGTLNASKRNASRVGPGQGVSAGSTNINNKNTITIVVSKDSDLKKVRKELQNATSQTVKQNSFIGTNPGLF